MDPPPSPKRGFQNIKIIIITQDQQYYIFLKILIELHERTVQLTNYVESDTHDHLKQKSISPRSRKT
jgi:hypothetical protein